MCDFLEDGNSGGGNIGGGGPLVSQPPQHQPPPTINTPQLTLTNPVVTQRKNSDVGLIAGECFQFSTVFHDFCNNVINRILFA